MVGGEEKGNRCERGAVGMGAEVGDLRARQFGYDLFITVKGWTYSY